MSRTVRSLIPALCLAVFATAAGAEEPVKAAPPSAPAELTEYIGSIGSVEGAQVAQATQAPRPAAPKADAPAGPQVIEFEMKKKPEGADLLAATVFQEYVTLDFKNADIQNVIRLISARTGLNILLDPSEVSGNITLHLENVKLVDALENILKVNKLAYIVESGNIVRIVPESRVGRDAVETQTVVIELNWRNAADIQKTFEPFLSAHGSIKANEEAQAIIITDTPPNVAKIRELISQIDRADRQVVIEARLVDIQVAAARDLTTSWSAAKTRGNPSASSADPISAAAALLTHPTVGGVLPVFIEGLGVNGGQGTLQFGTQISVLGSEYDINAALTALENRNVVEVIANPRVTTLNNVLAHIDIVERIPYIESVQGPTDGTVIGEVEFADAGVKIGVKPIITPNGFVRLDMELKQEIFRRRVGAGGTGALTEAFNPPQIDLRQSHSTVIVKDRNTVVLGGLRGIQKRDDIDGVPYLHRIPVIGWLFKDKHNDQSKNELVLMVTPIIVDEATLTDRDKELYTHIDTKWHLPDYFMDEVKSDGDKP